MTIVGSTDLISTSGIALCALTQFPATTSTASRMKHLIDSDRRWPTRLYFRRTSSSQDNRVYVSPAGFSICAEAPCLEIGSLYHAQTHKVFQKQCESLSVVACKQQISQENIQAGSGRQLLSGARLTRSPAELWKNLL